jgi:hypothetical protein
MATVTSYTAEKIDELLANLKIPVLLEVGQDADDVPPETPVGTMIFRKV